MSRKKSQPSQPSRPVAGETLGQRIQKFRKAHNYSQSELAAAAGINVRSLQAWEIDRREPLIRAAVSVARVLETTAEELVGG